MSTHPRLKLRAATTLVGAMGLTLLLSTACISTEDRGEWSRGNVLQINVSNVQRVPEVAYTVDGQHFAIRPRDPENTLVVAKVLLRNNKSAQVSLFIDHKAAFLANRRLERHGLVDPYIQRQPLDQPPEDGARFLPLLWGVVEVPQNFQIEGWVVFEIPQEFTVYQFNWEQADTIYVGLKEGI
jgi:hypothetical protein